MTIKKTTAAELMDKLNRDPELVAKRAREEEAHQERVANGRLAEAPLVDELRAVGLNVQSVWDLVNSSGSYPRAIPVLLQHLARPYPAPVREGIARALAVPGTKATGWRELIRLYRSEPERRVRDGLAVAIAATAGDDVIGEVVDLARDARLGSSRVLLLSALERSADPSARAALEDLGTDPDLRKEIRVILRRLKRPRR